MLYWLCLFPFVLAVAKPPPTPPPQTNESLYERMRYEGGLFYAEVMYPNDWWNKIAPYNIILGALPLDDKGHLRSIIDLGVNSVIAVVEDYELAEGWVHRPVSKQQWVKHGITMDQIEAEDFSPLTPNQMKKGVSILSWYLSKNTTVYIHCKSGVGRSASIVIAYVMITGKLSYKAAHALVANSRSHINVNLYQRFAIMDYVLESRKC
jgi:protein-tyrosine phosphatase